MQPRRCHNIRQPLPTLARNVGTVENGDVDVRRQRLQSFVQNLPCDMLARLLALPSYGTPIAPRLRSVLRLRWRQRWFKVTLYLGFWVGVGSDFEGLWPRSSVLFAKVFLRKRKQHGRPHRYSLINSNGGKKEMNDNDKKDGNMGYPHSRTGLGKKLVKSLPMLPVREF